MKLSVKKFSKKSLSLLIALIMVFSALPLTPPISAEAATTTIASNTTDVYCVSNHAASSNTGRFNMSGNGVNICNDGGSDNFNSGYFKIDISSLPEYIDTLSGAKLVVNIPNVNKGALGVDFYATTTILSASKNSYMSSTGDLARESAMNVYSNKIYLGSYVHIGNTTTAPGSVTINSDISEVVKYMRSSGLTSFGIVAMPIGVGSGNTNDNGNWSDVWVHDISLGTITYTAKTVNNDIDSLKNAITAYETKMASGNIYTNTKDAYDAYVTANKAYDSYYYGNNTSISILTAAQNLVKATNKMMTWTAYSPKTFGSFKGDNRDNFTSYNPTNYYKNLVYSQVGTGDGTEVKYSSDTSYKARIHIGKTVALYDGNEINIPVLASAAYDAYRANLALWGIYITSAGSLELYQDWKFQDTSANYVYLINGGSGATVTYTSTASKVTLNDRSYKFGANILRCKTNPFSSDEYYKDITPSFSVRIGRKGGNNAETTLSIANTAVDDYSPVYVLNYKALVDALNNNKSYLANVSKYKEGGIATKMTSFQSATAMNPSYYSYATDIASAVSTCASDIQTIVEYISGGTADNTNNYPKLRSAMDYSGTLPNFVSEGNSTQFTVRGAYNNGTNPGTFSEKTYSAFKTAYENAQSTMSTVYSSGYNKGSEAATNATALLNAFNALELSNYRVNFSTIDDYIWSNITKTVTVAKGGTVNSSDFPTITATAYSSNNKHNRYYWQNMTNQTEFTSQTEVNSDLDVVETKVEEACSIVNTGIEGDNVNLECSVCKHKSTLNASAYKAAVLAAQASIANSQAYSQDSRDALSSVLRDQDTAINKAKTQQEVDNCTSAIVSANQLKTVNDSGLEVGTLVLNQYSITFNVVDEFGNTTETVINAQSYDYGTLLNLQLPDTYQENAVSAWKRNINGADSVVGATSHSLQVMVTGKATYTAFVKKATTTPVNHVVITLNNKSNKVYDIGYVENNKVVDVNVDVEHGTITVGGQELTAPTYSFYKVKGFKINGDTVSSGTINITGDIVITPEYEAISSFTITGGNGVVEKSTTTSWDKRVRLTAETPAQSGKINKWTSTINGQNVVWGYGDTLSFQATQACTVECTEVDATEFNGVEDVKLSVDYVSYNLYRSNSITAISRVIAPEGAVVEYGTILKTANVKSGATNENYETQKLAVDNKDNYKVTNKSGVFKSTQMISNTNQFAYNFYSAQNYDKMYVGAVAYAKLSDGTYVYSDVVTYEFKR